jgi:phosphotransferase system enzyme I (PtsI)
VELSGIGVSEGVGIGQVHRVDRRRRRYPTHHVDGAKVPAELERLAGAFGEAQLALESLRERVVSEGGADHTPILDAHLLMLQDPMLTDGAARHIEGDRKCAEWAVRSVVHDIKARFDALGDDYFRERRSDIDFVGERVLQALVKDGEQPIDAVPEDAVVVAHDLSPADMLALLKRRVRAVVTEVGGATSHTAILARALEIPAVVGCADVLDQAGRGDKIVVDGHTGVVVLHPSRHLVKKFEDVRRRRGALDDVLRNEQDEPSVTRCGARLPLLANLELEDEIRAALEHGAEGVGLYRTEFLYLQGDLPDEDDHASAYGRVLDALRPDMPAVFRTFDLGSDKMSARVDVPKEDNPALGLRAGRLGLVHEDLMRAQLRGMLRATGGGRGAIMFPMISGVDELRRLKEVLHEEMDALQADGVSVWREVPVGIMVELPSAVWVADRLAEECDFFSVGTNDLIQYSLAIDRNNEHVAYLYDPLHLSNLRTLKHVSDIGRDAGIPVGLCGEMAAGVGNLPICLALGFDSLSMPLSAIPRVKYVLRRSTRSDATALLERCLACSTLSEVHAHVDAYTREVVPELAG